MLQSISRAVLSYANDRDMFVQKTHGMFPSPIKVELERATFWDDIEEAKNYARAWSGIVEGEIVVEMVEIKLCDRKRVIKV